MARYLFSSKFGGLSTGDFAELNLGNHVGDDEQTVEKNRVQLQSYLALQSLVFMNQTHGTEVFIVEINAPSRIDADALVTSDRSIGLAVLTADCIPLLIDAGNSIAAVHVGRKGLVNGIIPRVMEVLLSRGATSMKALLGPSICGKCYEVSPEMYGAITGDFPSASTSPATHCLDLPAAATEQLRGYGVITQNFHRCTLESNNYFSYRAKAITGRMAGVIAI